MDLVSVKFEIGYFILLKDRGNFFKSLSVWSLSKSGVRDF
jgi:hypothetical protein